MRVSIDCRYIRQRPSGIGAYTQALVDHLPYLDPASHFQLWIGPHANRPLSRAPNVGETLVRPEPNNMPTLLWPSALAELDDTDVLHLPYNILGRGIRCASVVTICDLMWYETPELCESSWLKRAYQVPFYRLGIGLALRHATRLVAISNATADRIAQVAPHAVDRVRVIHLGVHPRFQPASDIEQARRQAAKILGHDGPFFLALGQNAPYKNHGAVVAAFERAELPADVRLVLVQRLNTATTQPSSRVLVKPPLSRAESIVLMQACLALIQFSLQEGFGMPALEAMACGTAVITSDIPVLNEVVGDVGVRLPLQGQALPATLRRVVDEHAWRTDLGARGVERAKAFSWERCASAHLELYREAAEARA